MLRVHPERQGPGSQRHTGLFRGAVAFGIIAGEAASRQVLPYILTAARFWNYVIERKRSRRAGSKAILTPEAVPQKDALAGDRPRMPWHMPVRKQPYDAGEREAGDRCPEHMLRWLLNDGVALGDKLHRPPRRRDIDRHKGRIEDQDLFVG